MAAVDLPDDTHILEEIRTRFNEFYKLKPISLHRKTPLLRISINCANGKSYNTIFRIKLDGMHTVITNHCIKLEFTKGDKIQFSSTLHKNSPETHCFTPILVSDPVDVPNRITTTDVLSVIQLKLASVYPRITADEITVIDDAAIDDLHISPFRLLRGGNPIYQKYGLFNVYVPMIQTKIKSMTGKDLKNIIYNGLGDYKNKSYYDLVQYLMEKNGKVMDDNTALVDIMKNISQEDDKNNELSIRLVLAISWILKDETGDMEINIDTFKFNPQSAEWSEWRRKIVISNFSFTLEYLSAGGKRRTRKARHNKY